MTYGTVNADVVTTSTAGGVLGAGNASIMKNRIINGAMVIDQRNAGATVTVTTAQTYGVDRFFGQGSITSKFTAQQSTTAPAGFINSWLLTSSAATTPGASDYYYFGQNIEGLNCTDLGWGTANAKTITLSFQVYSSLTGTFSGAILNSANNRSYAFTYSIPTANTWTIISVTIAGDTSGTWLTTNGVGITLRFALGAGSSFLQTAGSWGTGNVVGATGTTQWISTSGATFYITGVQLEVGSSATGFEYRLYNQELLACQRYYQVYGGVAYAGIASGMTNNTNTQSNFAMLFCTTMRASPSLNFSNLIVTDRTAYDTTVSSVATSTISPNGTFIQFNLAATAGGANTPTLLCVKNGTTGTLTFSAEL
jgi:hypothetical protein